MPKDDRSNDYFKHLEQPASPPTQRRLKSPNEAPGPVAPAQPRTKQPTARTDNSRGPGLSPGMPVLERPVTGENPALRPRSGVMLTPQGIQRVEEESPSQPAVEAEELQPPVHDEAPVPHAKVSVEEGEVGWEEYAATDFPALPSEDLGVKTKVTDSGRVVPVALRADLTDEALKGKSVGAKAGRAPRPAKAAEKKKDAPRSWMGRMSDSVRRGLFGRIKDEDAKIDEWTEGQLDEETKGFAPSGSLKNAKSKRKASPARIVRGFVVEVFKLILLVLLLRAYVLQVSEVNGPSMDPTLSGGDGKGAAADRLVVERVTAHLANIDEKYTNWLPEFLHPRFRRGDIIVVRSPENPGSELVKRLIALPGDVIKFDKDKLFLKYGGQGEWQEVDESYLDPELVSQDGKMRLSYEAGSLPDVLADGKEVTVPDKRIFVMGDNRRHSNDSRRWLEIEVGKSETSYAGANQRLPGHNLLWLHMSSIEGRVVLRIYPFDRIWPPVK